MQRLCTVRSTVLTEQGWIGSNKLCKFIKSLLKGVQVPSEIESLTDTVNSHLNNIRNWDLSELSTWNKAPKNVNPNQAIFSYMAMDILLQCLCVEPSKTEMEFTLSTYSHESLQNPLILANKVISPSVVPKGCNLIDASPTGLAY
jgi:hypothetical protein